MSENYSYIAINMVSKASYPHNGNGDQVGGPKQMNNGHVYISGQSVRHAISRAMFTSRPDLKRGSAEVPNSDLSEDAYSDIFGFLVPGIGLKRASPLSVTSFVSQSPVDTHVLDNMVRYSDFHKLKRQDKKKKGDGEDEYTVDNRMMIKNLVGGAVYKGFIGLDLKNIGVTREVDMAAEYREEMKKESPNISKAMGQYSETVSSIDEVQKEERIALFLDSLLEMDRGFANQSRNAFNMYPEMMLIGLQANYNHYLSEAIQFDGNSIRINSLKRRVSEVIESGGRVIAVVSTDVFDNEDLVIDALESLGVDITYTSVAAIGRVKEELGVA